MNTSNNYRKMHGQPMRRSVQLRKIRTKNSYYPFKSLSSWMVRISEAASKAMISIEEWASEVKNLSKLVNERMEVLNEPRS